MMVKKKKEPKKAQVFEAKRERPTGSAVGPSKRIREGDPSTEATNIQREKLYGEQRGPGDWTGGTADIQRVEMGFRDSGTINRALDVMNRTGGPRAIREFMDKWGITEEDLRRIDAATKVREQELAAPQEPITGQPPTGALQPEQPTEVPEIGGGGFMEKLQSIAGKESPFLQVGEGLFQKEVGFGEFLVLGGSGSTSTSLLKSGATAPNVLKYTKQQATTESIKNIAKVTGKTKQQIKNMISTLKARDMLKKEYFSQMSVKKLATTIGISLASVGVSGVAGLDVITNWYALDNLIGGQKFYLGELVELVNNNKLEPDIALKAMQDARQTRQVAIDKLDSSARKNPLVWAFRGIIQAGVKSDQNAIDLKEMQIEQMASGQMQTEVSGFEERTQSKAQYDNIRSKQIRGEQLSQEEQLFMQERRGGELG